MHPPRFQDFQEPRYCVLALVQELLEPLFKRTRHDVLMAGSAAKPRNAGICILRIRRILPVFDASRGTADCNKAR